MLNFLLYFYAFWVTGYVVAVLYIRHLWKSIAGWHQPIESCPTISVLIPVKNEAENLPLLLTDLARQAYPSESFEVIVINDHSTDDTETVFNTLALPASFKFINLQNGSSKKAALTLGVSEAKFNWIATTDGDCRVSGNWLRAFTEVADNQTVLAAAPVAFWPVQSFFDEMQAVEFASLIATAAAGVAAGQPSMANGANLFYNKAAYLSVGGFAGNKQIASGDDVFLLHSLSQKYPRGIRFVKSKEATVHTKPSKSLASFARQRLRWAAKWKHYKQASAKGLALTVFGVHAAWLSLPLLAWLGVLPLWFLVIAFVTKAGAEGLLLRRVLIDTGQKFYIKAFLCWQLLYSLYAVGFGLAANFVSSVHWKGQKQNT